MGAGPGRCCLDSFSGFELTFLFRFSPALCLSPSFLLFSSFFSFFFLFLGVWRWRLTGWFDVAVAARVVDEAKGHVAS